MFGTQSAALSFRDKIVMLQDMMEKLFVISENETYHLKVENEEIPISQVQAQNKRENLLSSGDETSQT